MKNTSSVAYILRLVLTLFLICAVVAGALAGVNMITKDRIAAAKAEKTLQAISKVLPDGDQATEIDFTDNSGTVTAVYASPGGYAVKVAANGCKGIIDMMVGLDKDGKVLGICVISHSETAGIGDFISKDSAKGEAFREQFVGFDGSVDVVSGATITSKAVESGVLAAVSCVKEGL